MRGDRASADDLALVQAVAAGSEDALATLYDRHVQSLYAAVRRFVDDRQLAEEVVQETFLTLWNRAETFDPASGSLGAWLHAIARNRAVDRLRAAGRRPRLVSLAPVADGDDPELAQLERAALAGRAVGVSDPPEDPAAAIDTVELRAAVRAALDEMPETERQVLLLAYRDGLTQSEIADRLGWPLGTVKTRTRRALRRMRAVLAVALGDERLGEAPVPAGES